MTQQQLIDEGYVDGKKSLEYYLKEINQYFDFELVHKAMLAVQWKWYLGKTDETENYGIPTLETIKNAAYVKIKYIYEKGSGSTSSGGLTCGWQNGELYLEFTLEDCSIN